MIVSDNNVPLALATIQVSFDFSLITGSKLESMRFRSIAFAWATTVLLTEETKNSSKTWSDGLSTKQQ